MNNIVPSKIIQYRFVPDTTKVYYIFRNQNKLPYRPHTVLFYTNPYSNKNTSETINSLMCYETKERAVYELSMLPECTLGEADINTMKYYSRLLRIPMLVEMNSYCDIIDHTEYIDMFYYYKCGYTINDLIDSK